MNQQPSSLLKIPRTKAGRTAQMLNWWLMAVVLTGAAWTFWQTAKFTFETPVLPGEEGLHPFGTFIAMFLFFGCAALPKFNGLLRMLRLTVIWASAGFLIMVMFNLAVAYQKHPWRPLPISRPDPIPISEITPLEKLKEQNKIEFRNPEKDSGSEHLGLNYGEK